MKFFKKKRFIFFRFFKPKKNEKKISFWFKSFRRILNTNDLLKRNYKNVVNLEMKPSMSDPIFFFYHHQIRI